MGCIIGPVYAHRYERPFVFHNFFNDSGSAFYAVGFNGQPQVFFVDVIEDLFNIRVDQGFAIRQLDA